MHGVLENESPITWKCESLRALLYDGKYIEELFHIWPGKRFMIEKRGIASRLATRLFIEEKERRQRWRASMVCMLVRRKNLTRVTPSLEVRSKPKVDLDT
jgi:hypothetical protein